MDRLHSVIGATVVALVVALGGTAALPMTASAEPFANDSFQNTWARTDKPVSDLAVNRTWIWGPEAFTTGLLEPYDEGPNGQRMVQYFDKTRMEMTTDSDIGPDSVWYVTNGLLATEMISGELQLGNDGFEQHDPAQINIAGDAEDANAPTYATFNSLLGLPALEPGAAVSATISRDGTVGDDPAMLDYGVTAEAHVQETGHTVASVFWDFMVSEGTVYENGAMIYGAQFENAFFATGFPITEAYWSNIMVGGEPQDVLIQAFERRVLTYTPSNPDGWKVEAGNVGRHYHQWRYEVLPADGSENPNPSPPTTPPTTEPPITNPTPPASPVPVNVPAADKGTIGEAGRTPLGEDEYSELAEPYLDVPVSDEIPDTVAGQSRSATLNMQKNVSLYNAHTPSSKMYYVVDYNDGSIFVSPVIHDNVGLNAPHTWRGEGTFYCKAWTIDPVTGVRSEVHEFLIEVE